MKQTFMAEERDFCFYLYIYNNFMALKFNTWFLAALTT